MQIIVTNDITCSVSELPTQAIQTIASELTLDNPAYTQALKMGYSTYGKPPKLKLYNIDHGVLHLPRGYLPYLIRVLQMHNVPYTIVDERVTLEPVEFDSHIRLRDYQIPAVEALLRYEQGGVCAPCGSGKTVMGLAAIAQTRQPALWVTHTRELADQTIQRAVDVLGLERDEIGYIGGGKFTIGERLTVALVQTLSKRDLSDIADKFGCICVDEGHHISARSFFDSVSQFPARYRFWLSATPERSDGLTPMVLACGGPIVHNIPRSEVPTITPSLVVVETKYSFTHDNFSVLMNNLTNNWARNELIVKTIAKHAKGHYLLVLSDRLDHLRRLKGMIREKLPDMTIEILHGGLPKQQREEVMERARNREIDILLASSIAKEGLDLPHLDRLFLTTPKRSAATVEQEVGRNMRPSPGKEDAVVFDFRDKRNGMLDWQFNQRLQVY